MGKVLFRLFSHMCLIAFLSLGCGTPLVTSPKAVKGFLDLSGWNFNEKTISIDGDWEFYWSRTLSESNSNLLPLPDGYSTVPSSWRGFAKRDGQVLGGQGFATYRAVVRFPDNSPPLSLHALDESSSYRMFVNRELVAENGKFSKVAKEQVPSYTPKILDLPRVSGDTEILMEISNYHYAKGGFWESIEIGEKQNLYKKVIKTYQITSFIAGSIFLWGIYHLGLFWMRRKDQSALFLSLFCFFLVLRILTTGERLITDMFPGIDMGLLIRLEYTTFYIGTGVYAYFFRVTFPQTMSHRSIVLIIGSIVPFVLTLFLPVYMFSDKVIYFQVLVILICIITLWAITKAFFMKINGTGLSILGFLFVFATLVNDILYNNNVINTMSLTPFGFLGFTIFQGYILSYNYTKAYNSTERLNIELQTLKEGLEDLVFERTKELRESQERIQQFNEFAKALNSNLELETILKKVNDFFTKHIKTDSVVIFLTDPSKELIYYYKSILPNDFSALGSQRLRFLRFPMSQQSGFIYSVYKRIKPFRFSRIKKGNLTPSNLELAEIMEDRAGVIYPLKAKGEVIALMLLFSSKKKNYVTKKDLSVIQSASETVATAILNAMLLDNINKERNLAEVAKIEMETARNEVLLLNEFTKKINSESQLDKIIDEMFKYINKTFYIDGAIIQLLDDSTKQLYTIRTSEPPNATAEQIEFSNKIRIPLNNKGGIIYKTYLRKKPFYMANFSESKLTKMEDEILSKLNLRSFLILPILVQNEVIAMAYFTSYDHSLQLNKLDINRIAGFCDQIAGAILSSLLLRRTENEKKKVELARNEIHRLNEFSKKVNSMTDLESILAGIFQYIREYYKISDSVLYSIDEESQVLKYLNHSGFIDLADSDVKFFKDLMIPLSDKSSFIVKCFNRKRSLYSKKIREAVPSSLDKEIIKRAKLSSLIIVPLISNDKVVAMALFGVKTGGPTFNPEEIEGIFGVCEQIAGALNNHFLLQTIAEEKKKSDSLLLNILPSNVAEELQKKGKVNPVEFENVTMLMTGFPGFSGIASLLSPEELIEGLDLYFSKFDEICKRRNLEKLKMTSDMYVAAGGLPIGNFTHTVDACLAAIEIRDEFFSIKSQNTKIAFQPSSITIAIHSGPVVAGVIGKSKFSYDVWGKTVNQAQAIRRGGNQFPINMSKETGEKVNRLFVLDNERNIQNYEGESLSIIELKRLKPNLSLDDGGAIPNGEFDKLYIQQKRGAKILIK